MACSSCYNCGGSPCTTCGGYTPPPPPPPYVCPDPQPCDVAMDAECVLYTGDDLTCIGVTDPPKSVSSILVSLDQLLCQIGAGVTYVTSTNCIELDGDGTQGNPLTADPRINPSIDNLLQCTSGGLSTYLNTDDSECISLSGAGTIADPLIASPILDPDPDNLLSCGPDGLLVTGSTVEIADTNCINLSGNGTVASPITAAPIISTTAGNILSCTANGLLSKLNVNTAAGCVALSGDGTSGSPLAVSLNLNSTLQCVGNTLGVNPASIAITANNGLTMSTSTNVQLGGTLVQNTNVSLSGFTLTLKDTGAVPTGLDIIPGPLDDTDWNTSTATNVNIFTGRLLSQNISRFNTNVGIGVDPDLSTSAPGARLKVYKSYPSTSFPTSSTTAVNIEHTFNNGVINGNLSTSQSITANNVKLQLTAAPTTGVLTGNGAIDARYSATHTEFVFGVGNTSTVTTNGKIAAISSRLYFIYNSSVADEIITNRIMPPVQDSGGYSGTINNLIGLKIDDLRGDSGLSSKITKTYAIWQKGDNDENRYEGPTYHLNNVGIGITPDYNYPQGPRLQTYSESYTLPNNIQSSVLLSSNTIKLTTPSSGAYSVAKVTSDMNMLEFAFVGAGNSGAGSQSLASSGNWAAGFSYLKFSTGRTVTGTAAANSAQCNFITNIVNLTNCSGSGTTITCDSTTGLYVGQELYVIGGTGGWASTPTVASIINGVSFTVSAAPSVALSSATIQAKYDGTMDTIVGYRAMSPIADSVVDFNGTIAKSIGVLVEDQALLGSGTITDTYGIVQGSISNASKGENDINIINAKYTILRNLPIYADEAAAVTGGLVTGTIYQTATGELRIKL